jgi:phage FluMu protein Com
MQEIRCGQCQRKLAEAEFVRLTIKCPRCGTLNDVRALSPPPERHRASLPVESNNDKAQKHPGAL